MRATYGAIFVGFAVMGFSSVFNAHKPALNPARHTDRPAPPPVSSAAAPMLAVAGADSAITVQTELVEPQVVETDEPAIRPRADRRMPLRSKSLRLSRSLLARVVFGDGQFRPQPFPTPGNGLK